MGQHKIESPDKPKVPKTYQKTHNWSEALHDKIEETAAKLWIPILNNESVQVGQRNPDFHEAVEFLCGSMIAMLEAAAMEQAAKSRLVQTPDELAKQGAKLPLDLLRKA